MKTYWANFVKTGNPNHSDGDRDRDLAVLVSFRTPSDRLPHWPHFDTQGDHGQGNGNGNGNQKVQSLTPQGPQPFESFRNDHFCATWEPLLTFNNGNQPEQP